MEQYGYRVGKIAYEAYCETIGWKSAITRAALPPFDKTLEAVQTGWIAAGLAVLNHIEQSGKEPLNECKRNEATEGHADKDQA